MSEIVKFAKCIYKGQMARVLYQDGVDASVQIFLGLDRMGEPHFDQFLVPISEIQFAKPAVEQDGIYVRPKKKIKALTKAEVLAIRQRSKRQD